VERRMHFAAKARTRHIEGIDGESATIAWGE
jgi:hypothetical protein